MSDSKAVAREIAEFASSCCHYCGMGWSFGDRAHTQHLYPKDYKGMMAGLGPNCTAHRIVAFVERAILAAVDAERDECAKLAEAAHGAGAHTPPQRITAAAIRARGGRDGKGEPGEAEGRRDAAR